MCYKDQYKEALNQDGSFNCQICHKYIVNSYRFRKHMYDHRVREVNPIICPVCNKIQQSQLALEKHTIERHSGIEYKCDICSKIFSYPKGLKQHRQTHEPNYFEIFCILCNGKKFNNKSSFRNHVESKHSGEVYKCNICSKVFSTYHYLKTHQTNAHDDSYIRPTFECGECGKKFSTKCYLKSHHKTEHEGRKFVCSVCGKMMTSNSSLKTHMRRHTKEKPFSCPHCDKTFVANSGLWKHLHTHTKEKPHVCEFCGKSYSQRSHLVVHMKTVHKKERPFKCSICNKGFVFNGLLNSHMKTHTKYN